MIKRIGLILTIAMAVLFLGACNNNTGKTGAQKEQSYSQQKDNSFDAAKLNIVCCNFPEYDWVRNIIEGSENVDVWLLADNGTDVHSFQPSVDDMVKISTCDMFIYAGGESTIWMEDALSNAENENMTVINMVDNPYVYVKREDSTGILEEHDHEDDTDVSYDEHVWLSLYNAQGICDYITECLVIMDSENTELYETNCKNYTTKLSELDTAYRMVVDTVENDTVIFADRFPFKYMMEEYGLNYYAAFPGCSTETDASFQTIITLAEKMDESGLKHVVIVDGSDGEIAGSVIENTESKDAVIVKMYSMQAVTADDIDSGVTYLGYMEQNLEALSQVLDVKE